MGEPGPGWKRHRFGEMVASMPRKARGWSPRELGIDRYVGLEHLDSDNLKIRRWGSPEDVGANSDLRLFEPGDVIFARRRIEQRKLGVAEFYGVASGHALVFRARPNVVLPEFLPFFMQSSVFMGHADRLSVGSLSPTINWNTLVEQEFALPPLAEQMRFEGVLSAAERAFQSARDLADAAADAVDSFSASAFRGERRGAVVRHSRLGEVAANWPVVEVGALVEFCQYGLSMAPGESGQYPILRMTNLFDGRVVEEDLRYVDLADEQFAAYHLESGDVLFNRTNSVDLVGRVGVYALEGDYVFASYLIRLRVRRDVVSPEYLTAYLNAPLGRQQVLSFATKAISQANISASNLAKVLVPLPSRGVQDRIVADLSQLRQAQALAVERARQVECIKKTIVNNLVNGMRGLE